MPEVTQIEAPPLVVYHGNCMDGFTAAWACWLLHPDWEYWPGVHGERFPDHASGRDVYLLDFSYKLPVMEELIALCRSVTVLDHHALAQQELKPLFENGSIRGVFNLEHSGAYLSWIWFHGEDTKVPHFIQLVEDRDLWKFAIPGSKEASQYFFSFGYDFHKWSELARMCQNYEELVRLLEQGAAIERKHMKDVKELCEKLKFPVKIADHSVYAANLPYTHASDAAHYLCYDGDTFAATYYQSAEGDLVFSLRSTESGMDVSNIAQKYGGGGHPHAAGFRVPNLEALAKIEGCLT